MKKLQFLIIMSLVTTRLSPQPLVGIALSGGGALGFAHIGVLQALNENGIYPDCIAGTSMGAIIGGIYAAGYAPEKIVEIVHDRKFYRITHLMTLQSGFRHLGMSNHNVLLNTLRELIPHNSFDSLNTPFMACVTNLDLIQAEYIDTGGMLGEYIVASASIPGVFEAKRIGETTYVDGGVLDNLPARCLREKGCRYVIGVDVLPVAEKSIKSNAINVAIISIRAMQHANALPGIAACDWIINSYALCEYHEFSFDKYQEIYQYGYQTAIDYIKNHPEMAEKIKSGCL
ncbi:MAG: patatin-like phospholipase family protein [Candidatus Aphodosoma sp.]